MIINSFVDNNNYYIFNEEKQLLYSNMLNYL